MKYLEILYNFVDTIHIFNKTLNALQIKTYIPSVNLFLFLIHYN